MGDSGAGWWFGADRRWRKGSPPRGWRQGADGAWHPPGNDLPSGEPAGVEDTEADGRRSSIGSGHRDWSLATRIAGPLSIAVVALCAIVAIASVAGIASVQAGGTGDPADDVASLEPAPGRPATTGPPAAGGAAGGPTSTSTSTSSSSSSTSSTTSTSISTTTSTTTTEPPATGTTAEPPRSDASDPFALCGEGQLALLDRGNRPWSWIVARLDQDGDGILCN